MRPPPQFPLRVRDSDQTSNLVPPTLLQAEEKKPVCRREGSGGKIESYSSIAAVVPFLAGLILTDYQLYYNGAESLDICSPF